MNKRFMRFPEGKKKAVTLSYDDCMEEDADFRMSHEYLLLGRLHR